MLTDLILTLSDILLAIPLPLRVVIAAFFGVFMYKFFLFKIWRSKEENKILWFLINVRNVVVAWLCELFFYLLLGDNRTVMTTFAVIVALPIYLLSFLRIIVVLFAVPIKFLGRFFSLFENKSCQIKGCPNKYDDEMDFPNRSYKKYCRNHSLEAALDKFSELDDFLFFKPYPKEHVDSWGFLYSVNLSGKDGEDGWWGKTKEEQERNFNKVKNHLKEVGGKCENCHKNPARVGFYEDNEIDCSKYELFEDVAHSPKNLCFKCFSDELRQIFGSKNLFRKIIFEFMFVKKGEPYLFHYFDG